MLVTNFWPITVGIVATHVQWAAGWTHAVCGEAGITETQMVNLFVDLHHLFALNSCSMQFDCNRCCSQVLHTKIYTHWSNGDIHCIGKSSTKHCIFLESALIHAMSSCMLKLCYEIYVCWLSMELHSLFHSDRQWCPSAGCHFKNTDTVMSRRWVSLQEHWHSDVQALGVTSRTLTQWCPSAGCHFKNTDTVMSKRWVSLQEHWLSVSAEMVPVKYR